MKGVTLHEFLIVPMSVTVWHLIFYCNMALEEVTKSTDAYMRRFSAPSGAITWRSSAFPFA